MKNRTDSHLVKVLKKLGKYITGSKKGQECGSSLHSTLELDQRTSRMQLQLVALG